MQDSNDIRDDLGQPPADNQAGRQTLRTPESFNVEMVGINLKDELKQNRQKLKMCISEHEDALSEA